MVVAAIIQARMGSTRLPGKVLKPIIGAPMLSHVVERTRRAVKVDQVIVATTIRGQDEPIVDLCAAEGWPYFRGSENDLLDRYYRAALHFGTDVIVRITADCPLIDPGIIDKTVAAYLESLPRPDYVSTGLPHRTYPRGLDTEVFSFAALERAWSEDADPAWREHVTPYIYRHPGLFRLGGVTNTFDHSEMRWTVDTPEDIRFVRLVFEHFGHNRFSWGDVLPVLAAYPEWLAINEHIQQKVVPEA